MKTCTNLFSTVFVFLSAASSTAFAGESWVCSTAGPIKPVIIKYAVEGDLLTDSLSKEYSHKIVQNNEYGIIATSAIAEIENGSSAPSVGADVIIIDKRKLTYKTAYLPLSGDAGFMALGDQVSNGSCIKN